MAVAISSTTFAGRAAASVGSDRARIAALEQRIASDGANAQRLVLRYDQVQAWEANLTWRLSLTIRRLAVDRLTARKVTRKLDQVAVEAYVAAGGEAGSLAELSSAGRQSDLAQVYANVVAGKLNQAVAAYDVASYRVDTDKATLLAEQASAREALSRLAVDQRGAAAAVASDDAMLANVHANLHGLYVEAARRQAAADAAAEAAEERSLPRGPDLNPAQRTGAAPTTVAPRHLSAPVTTAPTSTTTTATATTSTRPSATTTTTSPKRPSRPVKRPRPSPTPVESPLPLPGTGGPPPGSRYVNPLRGIASLTPERIDQGVDYSGYGPIYAVGSGTVLSTVNAGWPGGTFITYRLTKGRAAGLTVYAAEDIYPAVRVGQSVTSRTVLGTVYEGPSGIETGWANGGLGDTMAMAAGQYSGGNSTAFGANFSALLQSLGAPGGILQNNPPTGTLPVNWPTW